MPRRRSFAVAINLFSSAGFGLTFRVSGSGKIAKRGLIASLQLILVLLSHELLFTRHRTAMKNVTNRRDFLKRSVQASLTLSSLGFAAGIPASAAEPVKRSGSPRLLLSLAAYSFRDYFVDANHARDSKTDPSKRIDM